MLSLTRLTSINVLISFQLASSDTMKENYFQVMRKYGSYRNYLVHLPTYLIKKMINSLNYSIFSLSVCTCFIYGSFFTSMIASVMQERSLIIHLINSLECFSYLIRSSDVVLRSKYCQLRLNSHSNVYYNWLL